MYYNILFVTNLIIITKPNFNHRLTTIQYISSDVQFELFFSLPLSLYTICVSDNKTVIKIIIRYILSYTTYDVIHSHNKLWLYLLYLLCYIILQFRHNFVYCVSLYILTDLKFHYQHISGNSGNLKVFCWFCNFVGILSQ